MILQADATRLPLADQVVDLVVGSPPYCDARWYGDKDAHARGCLEWVEWMLEVTNEALRVCRGPVIWVCAGVTRDRTYWPACEGLLWEWWKRGGSSYRPVYWYRSGIPGSGGDQWFRADVEYCLCFKRPGKLPWADNTVMGHPPKWAPGGEMSYRLSDGDRVNYWGRGESAESGGSRRANGNRRKMFSAQKRQHTKGKANGDMEVQEYVPPVIANPGNLIRTNTGGGRIGDRMAHENEAPFPEKLPEWFILSLCPPGGTVLDPFSGSGTTAKVAKVHGRNFIAADLRFSQCELTRRRTTNIQRDLLSAVNH